MLTYHATAVNDQASSYWISAAVELARSVGAHNYEDSHGGAEISNKLKRLWWCCVLRDRIMALGLCRPLVIQPSDFDFSRKGLVEQDFDNEIGGSEVCDSSAKRHLADLFASLCELASHLNDVLTVCYPAGPSLPGDPDCSLNDPTVLRRYVVNLDAWHETLVAKFGIPSSVHGIHESVALVTNSVYIYY